VVESLEVTRLIRASSQPQPRWAKRRAAAKRASRRGTIRYRLSRAAVVRIRIQRRGARGPHLTLRRHGDDGGNAVRFSARLAGRRLTPGRYRVSIVALANGRRSQEGRAGFRVLQR
jgi:hypothetical protein